MLERHKQVDFEMSGEKSAQAMADITDGSGLVENAAPIAGHAGINTNTPNVKKKGLTIFTAAVFIVGEMAGGGILSLPDSLVSAGWGGVALLVFCAVMSAYTGIILGRCWQILKERFATYRENHVRYPYPAIGCEAMGKIGRYAVTVCVNFTLFSVTTVFLLVASKLIHELLCLANVHLSFCVWIPIIAAVLCPFTWLGTPKDFWPIAAGAAFSTGIACILIFIQEMLDSASAPARNHPPPSFQGFFTAFGAILFAFGGHAIFPSVQHDMKDTRKFNYTVYVAYIVVVAYYLPVSVGGYAVYGDTLKANILDTLGHSTITTVVKVMISLHLLMGAIIVINPFCQELEEMLHAPLKFSWQRVVIRSFVMAAVLFVAETIPEFSVILNIVGGTTVTLLTFVFPSLFYILLRRKEPPADVTQSNDLRIIHGLEYVLHGFIILVGVVGGVASTYSEVYDIATSSNATFSAPCYVSQHNGTICG